MCKRETSSFKEWLKTFKLSFQVLQPSSHIERKQTIPRSEPEWTSCNNPKMVCREKLKQQNTFCRGLRRELFATHFPTSQWQKYSSPANNWDKNRPFVFSFVHWLCPTQFDHNIFAEARKISKSNLLNQPFGYSDFKIIKLANSHFFLRYFTVKTHNDAVWTRVWEIIQRHSFETIIVLWFSVRTFAK